MAQQLKMTKVTVAPGRNVSHADRSDSGAISPRTYRPGEMFDMPVEEAVRLRELGFLVDPSGSVPVAETAGPTVLRDDTVVR